MGTFVLLVVLAGAVWMVLANQNATRRRLADAHRAYQDSLAALKRNPTDPDLKQQTLSLGRAYSNLTRQQKGVTIYDEVALSNDIGAACAAATRHQASTETRPSAEARITQLKELHAKGLVTPEEYELQRQRILRDL